MGLSGFSTRIIFCHKLRSIKDKAWIFSQIKRYISTHIHTHIHTQTQSPRRLLKSQAPLSMGFSRQEQWKGLLFPSPRSLPSPGIEPRFPALQADALPSEWPGKPSEIIAAWYSNSTFKNDCYLYSPCSRVGQTSFWELIWEPKHIICKLFSKGNAFWEFLKTVTLQVKYFLYE